MLSLLTSAAFATPTFTGTAADVALAEQLWPAAVTCAQGRVPRTAPVVPIERGSTDDLYSGKATIGEQGLQQIWLASQAPSIVMAHEIAHAWFYDGPLALVEGRAEVMAECVAQLAPRHVRFFRGESLVSEHLSDLTQWGAARVDDRYELSALYSASWRLFRVLELVIERPRIWEVDSWARLDEELASLGGDGERIAEVLAGGEQTQREALGDADLDGIVNLHEALIGTDPDRWDSDGDGWWDGLESHPENAVPVPRDGTPVCVPFALPNQRRNTWTVAGNLRGFDVANISIPRQVGNNNVMVRFMRQQQAYHGGYWLQALGDSLVPSPRCAWLPGVTVTASRDEAVDELRNLAAGIAEAQARFTEALGPPDSRVVVRLEEDGPGIVLVRQQDQSTIEVPRRLLTASPDGLYSQIVALSRVAWSGFRSPSAASVALARHVDDERYRPLTPAFRAEVRRAAKMGDRCERGWVGLLAGDCANRDSY